MILSVSYQFKIFLTSLLIGLILGIFYDFIKIFRKYVLHNNIIINIEDTIYWIFMSIVIFLVVLYQNDGEIRNFFIIGIFTSVILYHFLISKIFIKIFIKIINLFLLIFSFIIKAISFPFLIVYNIIFKPILKILKNIFKAMFNKFAFFKILYKKINNVVLHLKGIKGDKKNEKYKKQEKF